MQLAKDFDTCNVARVSRQLGTDEPLTPHNITTGIFLTYDVDIPEVCFWPPNGGLQGMMVLADLSGSLGW